MGAHVRHRAGLSSRPSRSGRRRTNARCGATTGETAADLAGGVELSTREGSGSEDRIMRAVIARSVRLKEREYTFNAISRPCRHYPAFGVAQRLGRTHSGILPTPSALIRFESATSM
ncbi:MAG TPA: hypothetical protein VFN55_15000 [Solirubrobacteraceae bacterium]|nr:hypothetical protein [Solirubrobacteraceae bacterium]